ncbi:ribonuclease J [Anaplasmataceae bacterium AB001_6]|nr:ribonuclease J [Anaplasmataceae bacterium AB001_6]
MSNSKEGLLFLPIGGTCEIGMNLTMYRQNGKWLIVDCGAGFAGEEFPGIDITVMNNAFIEKNKDDVVGIIITHIHEDHCGGLSNLLSSVDIDVYSTKFVIEFLRTKMEPEIYNRTNFIELKSNGRFNIGPFDCELVSMVHSTPEMHAVVLHTDQGLVYHTGDWKLDSKPVIGESLDEDRLKSFSEKGVLALICDSTNVFSPGSSGCEYEIVEPMHKIFSEAKAAVAVTLFASNVARIQTIWSATKASGRKLLVLGRSLHSVIESARASGYLDDIEYFDKYSIEEATKVRDNLVILCTGCQGDKMGATRRLADNEYRDFHLSSGDTFVFSSKIIPGNEKKIYEMINGLSSRGIDVITEKDAKVHVSGHPYREELKYLYSFLKPKIAIPVHGEYIHLKEHVKLAQIECGIEEAILVSNGDVISLSNENGAKKVDEINSEVLGIDGDYLYPVNSRVLKMRRSMQKAGLITVFVMLKVTGQLVKRPAVSCFGCFGDKETNNEIVSAVESRIKAAAVKRLDGLSVTRIVRQAIKKFCNPKNHEKIPFIHVHTEFLNNNSLNNSNKKKNKRNVGNVDGNSFNNDFNGNTINDNSINNCQVDVR